MKKWLFILSLAGLIFVGNPQVHAADMSYEVNAKLPSNQRHDSKASYFDLMM